MWILLLTINLLILAVASSRFNVTIASGIPLTGSSAYNGDTARIAISAAFEMVQEELDYDLHLDMFDDETSPSRGITQLLTKINAGSVAFIGAHNSGVSIVEAGLTHYLQFVQASGGSSSPQLEDKKQFSTFLRSLPGDDIAAPNPILLALEFNWQRICLLATDDAFGTGQLQAWNSFAALPGIETKVVAENIVPYDLKNTDAAAIAVDTALENIQNAKGFIIFLGGTTSDVRFILERAYLKNMLGKDYTYIGVEWGTNALFDGWELAQKHPYALEGLFTVTIGCIEGTAIYSDFLSRVKTISGNDGYSPSHFTCKHFDNAYSVLRGLNKTYEVMDTAGVDRTCLQHSVFYDNLTECNVNVNLADLKSEAQCNDVNDYVTDCERCGVCSLIDQGTADNPVHIWQTVLLNQMYDINFTGVTGSFSFDKHGGRDTARSPLSIYNSRVNRDTNALTFDSIGSMMVGSLDDTQSLNVKFDFQMEARFSGGTAESIQSDPILDDLATRVFVPSLGLRIFWTILGVFGLTLTTVVCICFYTSREYLVIKSSSPKVMNLMLFGASLSYIAILVLTWGYDDGTSCVVHCWLLTYSFFISFGCVIAKTYRIKVLFIDCKQAFRKSPTFLKDQGLFVILIFVLLFVTVFLVIWTILDTPNGTVQILQDNINGDEIRHYCLDLNWFYYGISIAQFCLMIYACFLAYFVLDAPSFYNESRVIAITVYNWFVFYAIAFFVFIAIDDLSPDVTVALQNMTVFSSFTLMVLCFHGQKLFLVWKGHGNDPSKTFHQPSSARKQVTNRNTNYPNGPSNDNLAPLEGIKEITHNLSQTNMHDISNRSLHESTHAVRSLSLQSPSSDLIIGG